MSQDVKEQKNTQPIAVFRISENTLKSYPQLYSGALPQGIPVCVELNFCIIRVVNKVASTERIGLSTRRFGDAIA